MRWLRVGFPHGLVAGRLRRLDALAFDVGVDVRADRVVGGVRLVERRLQRRFEGQPCVLAVGQRPVQPHALGGEATQVDVAPAVAAGDVVVGLLDRGLAAWILGRGLVVEAHVGQPRHAVAAAVEPGHAGRTADREVHLPSGEVQVLGDLRSGLPGADHQHGAIRQLIRVAVLLRMQLGDRRIQRAGEAGITGMG